MTTMPPGSNDPSGGGGWGQPAESSGWGATPGAGPAQPGYGPPPAGGLPSYGQFGGQQAGWSPNPQDSGPYGGPLAGWGIRLGGWVIDIVIASIITAVFQAIGGATLGNLVNLVVAIIFAVMIGVTGSTPGMMAVGLKAVNMNTGKPIGVPRAIGRAILRAIDTLIVLIGSLWPLWDANKQTLLGDKVTSTVVIRTRL
jgi:uncharacterized RDD family membrane protein YckC